MSKSIQVLRSFVQSAVRLAALDLTAPLRTKMTLLQCAPLFCTYPGTGAKAALARVPLVRMPLAPAVPMNGSESVL